MHTDALGSPVAYTGSNGSVLPGRSMRYEPYGTPTMATREGEPSYTGHQYDASTGLIYAQQRYYDPMLGRFLGVDPMAVDTGSAFNWNRYAYANNSPYKFTDPDGRVVVVPAIYAVVEAIAWASAAYVVTSIAVDSVRDSGLTAQDVGMGSLLLMNPTLAGSMNEAAEPQGQTGEGTGAITSDRPAGTDGKRGSTGGPGAGKRFSPETPEVKADKEGVPCAYCGVPTTNEPGQPNSRERDHIDPKSRGGNNTSENERDSCRTCNRQKGPKNPDEWQPKE